MDLPVARISTTEHAATFLCHVIQSETLARRPQYQFKAERFDDPEKFAHAKFGYRPPFQGRQRGEMHPSLFCDLLEC